MPMNMPVSATTGRLNTPTWYSTGRKASRRGSRATSQTSVRQANSAKSPTAATLLIATRPQSEIQSRSGTVKRRESSGSDSKGAPSDISHHRR